MAPDAAASLPEPRRTGKALMRQTAVSPPLMLRALWHYRSFIWGMVAREFRARYVSSLLGGLWAVLHPLALIVIYTIVFGGIMRVRLPGTDDTLSYTLYLCAGLFPWFYFSELLQRCQTVFLEHANLLKKISFPRISLPVILLLSSTVNFAIVFTLFVGLLLVTGRFPGLPLLGFLPLLFVQQALALGLGIFLGTLNVFYRDVAQSVAVVLQFWFWLTPIIYTVAILPETVQRMIVLNPLYGPIRSYQQIVLLGEWPPWSAAVFPAAAALAALAAGFFVFQKLSGEIVDEI
jgi:lipopolysaccharide transport system permease protein